MNRRTFIQTGQLAGAGALMAQSSALAQSAARKPEIKNIVMVFVDQQRHDCLGCSGNPVVKTPNIDRLARTGVRFTNAYTPAPVCTPARTSLQTGLLAHKHKLIFNTKNHSPAGGLDDPEPGIQFFGEHLRDSGWQCAHIGKWHIGNEINRPAAHGYDDLPYYPLYGYPRNHPHYREYLKSQGVDGFNLLRETKDPTGTRPYDGLQEGPQSASIPAYLAQQTTETIRKYADNGKPFFVSCNFWGPHAPYNITRKHYEMYDNADIDVWPNFDCDLSDKPGVITRYGEYWKTGWFTRENLKPLIARYYGYISLIDEEIGRILDTLEETGQLDSTLIVYSADHGSSVGSYRFWDKGFGMYDAITRIPMVASHPSFTPSVSDGFVSLVDLAPTFLDAAGVSPLDRSDGVSLMPVLRGDRPAVRGNYIVTEHHGHQLPFWQRMVRTPTFKYIFNPVDRDEFYDLANDPWETKNVIDSADTEKLAWAKTTLLDWMDETKDPLLFWARPVLS